MDLALRLHRLGVWGFLATLGVLVVLFFTPALHYIGGVIPFPDPVFLMFYGLLMVVVAGTLLLWPVSLAVMAWSPAGLSRTRTALAAVFCMLVFVIVVVRTFDNDRPLLGIGLVLLYAASLHSLYRRPTWSRQKRRKVAAVLGLGASVLFLAVAFELVFDSVPWFVAVATIGVGSIIGTFAAVPAWRNAQGAAMDGSPRPDEGPMEMEEGVGEEKGGEEDDEAVASPPA